MCLHLRAERKRMEEQQMEERKGRAVQMEREGKKTKEVNSRKNKSEFNYADIC